MGWSHDRKYYYWEPNDMNDKEISLILESLRSEEDDKKILSAKIWCWKMNYRNKDYGLS